MIISQENTECAYRRQSDHHIKTNAATRTRQRTHQGRGTCAPCGAVALDDDRSCTKRNELWFRSHRDPRLPRGAVCSGNARFEEGCAATFLIETRAALGRTVLGPRLCRARFRLKHRPFSTPTPGPEPCDSGPGAGWYPYISMAAPGVAIWPIMPICMW